MVLQLTLVVLLWLVGIGALGVLALIRRRGQLTRRPALSLFVLGSALYAFGYAIELTGASLDWVFATLRVQYLAIAFAPALLLWLAAEYAPRGWLGGRAWRVAALTLSLATLLVVYTEPWHGLFHANARMDASGPFPLFAFDRGPWYWGFQAYAAAAVVAAGLVFLRVGWSARGPLRTQARSLFVASVAPWAGSLVNLTGVLPLALDAVPFTLAITSLALYLGVVRRGLADLAPIARDLVFERMGDAAVVLDPEGRVLDLNRAAVRLLGPLTEEAGSEARPLLAERHPELAAVVAATEEELDPADVPIRQTLRDEPSVVTLAERSYSIRLVELREGRRRHLGRVLVLRDISRYVELEARLRELATTDELTGIPNRRHFLMLAGRDLERARRSGRPLTVMVFDLDRFKRVNDTFGHQVGDEVLRTVAIGASVQLRTTDVVGRLGGEEFAICLPDTDAAGAAVVARRLRNGVAGVVVPAGSARIRITVSIGCYTVAGRDLPNLGLLLARADEAQYEAKARGGNQVVACRDDGTVPTLRAPAPSA